MAQWLKHKMYFIEVLVVDWYDFRERVVNILE